MIISAYNNKLNFYFNIKRHYYIEETKKITQFLLNIYCQSITFMDDLAPLNCTRYILIRPNDIL